MEKQEQGQTASLLQALGPRHRNVFLVNRAGHDSKYISPGGKLGVLPIFGTGWLRVIRHHTVVSVHGGR